MTPRPIAATGLRPRNPGDPRALRTYLRQLQRKPDGDADDPTYNLHQGRASATGWRVRRPHR